MFCEVAARTGFCSQCYDGLRHRRYHPGHRNGHLFRRTFYGGVRMAIKRASGAANDGGSRRAVLGGDAAGYFPCLWEFVSSECFDDGGTRATATLLIIVEEGLCKLCLNDRAETRKAWVSSGDVLNALQTLEERLKDGTVEWRADKPWKPGKGK